MVGAVGAVGGLDLLIWGGFFLLVAGCDGGGGGKVRYYETVAG